MSEASKHETFPSIEAMYRHYDSIGRRNEDRWTEIVSTFASEVFEICSVNSAEEFVRKYCNANYSGNIAYEKPLASVAFGDYMANIGLSLSGRGVLVQDTEKMINRSDYQTDLPPKNVLDADSPGSKVNDSKPRIAALAWKGVIGNMNHLYHVGVWSHTATDQGFGYATYRLYESLFGKIAREAASGHSGTSILKLYLSLGFRPVAMHDPESKEISETGEIITQISDVDPGHELFGLINGESKESASAVFEFERQE